MRSVNKLLLSGRLGRDPEVKQTSGGNQVANFSIAVGTGKDKDTGEDSPPEWWPVVLWGRQAELAGQLLAKGCLVLIDGRAQRRKYTGKDETEREAVELVGWSFDLLARPRGADQETAHPEGQAASAGAGRKRARAVGVGLDPIADEDDHPPGSEDLPF